MAEAFPRRIKQQIDYPVDPGDGIARSLCMDDATGLFYWSGGLPDEAAMDAANVGDVVKLAAGKRSFELAAEGSGSLFAQDGDWSNVMTDYSVANVDTEHTLAATATAGNNYIDLVVTPTDYTTGHGIALPGMGTAGAELLTTVSSRSGNRLYLATTIKTTVSAGATVYHDDSVAWQSVFSETLTSIKHWCPYGNSLISQRIDSGIHGRSIKGVDHDRDMPTWAAFDNNGSTLWSRHASDPMIYFGSDDCLMKGFRIKQHPSVTRTSGFMVVIAPDGSPTYPQLDRLSTETLHIARINFTNNSIGSGVYSCIQVNRLWNANIDKNQLSYFSHIGIEHNCDAAAGGFAYNENIINGNGTVATGDFPKAFRVTASDLNRYTGNRLVGLQTYYEFEPVLGRIGRQAITDGYYDGPKSGATIFRVKNGAYGCEGTKVVGGVINVSQAAYIADIESSADGFGISDVTITNGYSVPTTPLFNISGKNVSITNNNIRSQNNNNYKYSINSGANNAVITGNTHTGISTHNEVYIHNGAINPLVQSNGFQNGITYGGKRFAMVNNNNNELDYITSIASAPDFIGQTALVSGVWYKAAGTASTADWKALN